MLQTLTGVVGECSKQKKYEHTYGSPILFYAQRKYEILVYVYELEDHGHILVPGAPQECFVQAQVRQIAVVEALFQ